MVLESGPGLGLSGLTPATETKEEREIKSVHFTV